MSSLTPDAVKALKATHRKLPKKLNAFDHEHDAALPSEVAEDGRYDFRVLLLPQTGPKTESDAVMRFVRDDEMAESNGARATSYRRSSGTSLSQSRTRAATSRALLPSLSPGTLGVKFSPFGHIAAWKHYKVRPEKDAARPELTDDRYCVWDEPHSDYLYTHAWVKKLVQDLADPETFETVTGKAPESLPQVDASASAARARRTPSLSGCSGARR